MRMWKLAVPMVVFGLLALAVHTRAMAEETKGDKGTISGSVVDKDGKAVASAKVRLMAPKDKEAAKADKAAGSKPSPIAEGTTDTDGKFTFKDVAVGKYVVNSMLKGVGNAKHDVEVKAGETATVELKLEVKEPKTK